MFKRFIAAGLVALGVAALTAPSAGAGVEAPYGPAPTLKGAVVVDTTKLAQDVDASDGIDPLSVGELGWLPRADGMLVHCSTFWIHVQCRLHEGKAPFAEVKSNLPEFDSWVPSYCGTVAFGMADGNPALRFSGRGDLGCHAGASDWCALRLHSRIPDNNGGPVGTLIDGSSCASRGGTLHFGSGWYWGANGTDFAWVAPESGDWQALYDAETGVINGRAFGRTVVVMAFKRIS